MLTVIISSPFPIAMKSLIFSEIVSINNLYSQQQHFRTFSIFPVVGRHISSPTISSDSLRQKILPHPMDLRYIKPSKIFSMILYQKIPIKKRSFMTLLKPLSKKNDSQRRSRPLGSSVDMKISNESTLR